MGAASMNRPLQLWEHIGYTMNVTLFLNVTGPNIDETAVRQAWAAAQQEFPYLRMVVKWLAPGAASFSELEVTSVSCDH